MFSAVNVLLNWTVSESAMGLSKSFGSPGNLCFAYMRSRVHRRVRWGLVWVPGMEVGIVGVVMGVVSLRVMVSTLAVALAVVVVVAVVLVGVGRCLQVLVRVWVHVMVGALVLPRWHHLHHVAHGVHVAVCDGTRMVWKCSLQPLIRQNGNRTQRLTSFSIKNIHLKSVHPLTDQCADYQQLQSGFMSRLGDNEWLICQENKSRHSGCPLSLLQSCHCPTLPSVVAVLLASTFSYL